MSDFSVAFWSVLYTLRHFVIANLSVQAAIANFTTPSHRRSKNLYASNMGDRLTNGQM
jgi:hypothetical protein